MLTTCQATTDGDETYRDVPSMIVIAPISSVQKVTLCTTQDKK